MSTTEYVRKRDFSKTREPSASSRPAKKRSDMPLRFVVQKHDARNLHYDFRLEHNGALLSWAVPKGPSLDPDDKRLAVRVEDHPLEYATFEGSIPEGEYGGGTVMVWDAGAWMPDSDVDRGLKKGRLTFTISGEKLNGRWHLARMGGRDQEKENWLLIKGKDDFANPSDGDSILAEQAESVLSGRSLEEIAGGSKAKQRLDLPENCPKLRMPTTLDPQLATLADSAPQGDEWIYEIKYDGYRILSFCRKQDVVLRTRNHNDWTEKFTSIQKRLAQLGLTDCILDGELVAIDQNGVSNFQALQNAMKGKTGDFALRYMVFDLPYAQGHDLRGAPLEQRKRLLRALLSGQTPSSLIQYSDHMQGSGDEIFQSACSLQLEGIICKNTSSPYLGKRSKSWLKVKCQRRQEFIVCGFTEPSGSRVAFGALHLAVYDHDHQLRYAGKVGTGFDEKQLKTLHTKFKKLAVDECPLPSPPAEASRTKTTWIEPKPIAEIKFAELTDDGMVRQAVFMGLREDKTPDAIRWELPAPVSDADHRTAYPKKTTRHRRQEKATTPSTEGVKLTNPDRVLYPSIKATKKELAAYYESVAEHMLPYIAKRPLSLLRHPQGVDKKGFFQKHVDDSFPASVHGIDLSEDSGTSSVYGYVTGADGLVALLQMGTLEMHVWNARIDDVERPDQIVMDLDPDEGLASDAVVGAALLLRDLLSDKAGLKSFLKTTGGKGLHLVIPIRRGPSWQLVKEFSKAVADALQELSPNAFTTTSSKAKRKGKIFIDYLRNGRGATAIAPFSTRARPGAPVSVPLSWNEAVPSLKSDRYNIKNVARRLAQLKSDPWDGYHATRQGLTRAVLEAFGLSPER